MISRDMTKTPLLFATRKVKSHRKTLSFITAKNGIEGHSPEVISCLRHWNWSPFFISISLLFLCCYCPFYFLSCNVFFPFLNIVMKSYSKNPIIIIIIIKFGCLCLSANWPSQRENWRSILSSLSESFWRRADARNVIYRIFLLRSIQIINSVENTLLSNNWRV